MVSLRLGRGRVAAYWPSRALVSTSQGTAMSYTVQWKQVKPVFTVEFDGTYGIWHVGVGFVCYDITSSAGGHHIKSLRSIERIHHLRKRSKYISCIRRVGGGGTVAISTLASHQGEPGSIPDFRKWESCRTMSLSCGFSRGSPVSPDPPLRRRFILTSITLIGSQDLAVNNRQKVYSLTHSCVWLLTIRNGELHRYDGNTPRLVRRSDEALEVRVSVARIAPSLLDFGRAASPEKEGAAVAERFACSPPTKANRVQSPAVSLRIFASGNRAGLVFSGMSRFSRPCIPPLLHPRLTSSHPTRVEGIAFVAKRPPFSRCVPIYDQSSVNQLSDANYNLLDLGRVHMCGLRPWRRRSYVWYI
ncbi:hypothetical protein PR048_031352 [Dryococelus australis]|uniref:Uncharacterized protein n=1 Tax=Dryococelus australis TaxID=614101 RepID=A0ABQ9G504_9NEOP|nr:hypothetical protein PR048_031352 [Dryococelus australis]